MGRYGYCMWMWVLKSPSLVWEGASRVEIEMDFDLTDLIIWSLFTHAGDFDMFIQLVIYYTLYNLEIAIVPQVQRNGLFGC